MSRGVYPVACCVPAPPPSEELLHAVKQTVVSVWPFQWGIFSPPRNRAKKQNVNLETKRKKQSDKCHHDATISGETARPTPTRTHTRGATTITTQQHPRMSWTQMHHTHKYKYNTQLMAWQMQELMRRACLNCDESYIYLLLACSCPGLTHRLWWDFSNNLHQSPV